MCPKCLQSFAKWFKRSCAYKQFIAILYGQNLKFKRAKIHRKIVELEFLGNMHIVAYNVSLSYMQWFKRSCTYKLFITIFNIGPNSKFKRAQQDSRTEWLTDWSKTYPSLLCCMGYNTKLWLKRSLQMRVTRCIFDQNIQNRINWSKQRIHVNIITCLSNKVSWNIPSFFAFLREDTSSLLTFSFLSWKLWNFFLQIKFTMIVSPFTQIDIYKCARWIGNTMLSGFLTHNWFQFPSLFLALPSEYFLEDQLPKKYLIESEWKGIMIWLAVH